MSICGSGGGTPRRIRASQHSSSCTIPRWKICASSSHRTCRSCGACLASAKRKSKCTARKSWTSSAAKETLRLLEEGRTFEQIAQIRARTLRAVVSLVADLIERGEAQFQPGWLASERYNQIAAACRQLGMDRLKPLKEALPPEIPYEEIRLVIARLRNETASNVP